MKRKILLCGVVLILGLFALGCDNPSGSDDGDIALDGTLWTGDENMKLTFSGTAYEMTISEESGSKGTYTVAGDILTLTMTHILPNTPQSGTYTGTIYAGNRLELKVGQDTIVFNKKS